MASGTDVLTPQGVRLRLRGFRPFESTAFHEHEHPYICLIVDGESEQDSGGQERLRRRGQVFYYPARELQRERFGGAGGLVFAVDMPSAEWPLPPRSMELAGRTALLARRLHAAWSQLGTVSTSVLDETAVAVLQVLARESADHSRWLVTARDYIHANFKRRVSLSEIARTANVHPVHLSRSFPARFGTTVGGYLRSLRLDFAARELAASDRPIAEIALDAGFASQSHLTQCLKQRIGLTPAAYRDTC